MNHIAKLPVRVKTTAQSRIMRWLLSLPLGIFLSSCANLYYPSHINSAFIQEKGETNMGGALSLTSMNAQVSSAPTDHLRLAAGLNFWGWAVTLGSASIGESALQGQMLAGYYTQLGDKVFFEGYGGVGFSATTSDFFGHGILQPSLGFGKGHPKFVISLRTSYLNNALFSDPDEGAMLGPDETHKISGFYHDVAFTHRLQRPNTTWFLQYGMSGGDIQRALGDNAFVPFLNVGVNYRLLAKE
ncbi:MAG: hypothetical protein AAFQ83_13290 [Bacteroidota bacterium]